jgi:hypothetical protein
MREDGQRERDAPSMSAGLDAWVRAALSTVRPDGSVTSVDPIEAGGRRPILAVRFADADPIVIRRGDDAAAVDTEAELLAAVASETTVPAPAPLGWGPSPDGTGGWLATPLVAGDDLHERFVAFDPPARRDLAAAFGGFLGEVHATFRFDEYGPLGADAGDLRAANRSPPPRSDREAAWRDWLTARGHERLDRLPAAFADVADAARARLDAWTTDTAPTPRLFPWDFRPGNALVTDDTIAAIVDWEAPLAAGAALSVAKTEYLIADWFVPDEADTLRRAFRNGYRETRPLPAVDDVHRIVAIAETAVDSHGVVTNPRYPPVEHDEAVWFHRRHLEDAVY